MDVALIKSLLDAGASVVLAFVVFYLIKFSIPELVASFTAAMEKKRVDDAAILADARKDYLNAEQLQRGDYLQAQERLVKMSSEAVAQQRTDYLASAQAQMSLYGQQLDRERETCERRATLERESNEKRALLDREANRENVERIAKSVTNLADIIIFQRQPQEEEITENTKRRAARELARGREVT
jgi:hypothetical protein